MNNQWHIAVCDVCRLLDGDLTLKLCFHCGQCDAEICMEDADAFGRRAKAAMLRRIEVFRLGISA